MPRLAERGAYYGRLFVAVLTGLALVGVPIEALIAPPASSWLVVGTEQLISPEIAAWLERSNLELESKTLEDGTTLLVRLGDAASLPGFQIREHFRQDKSVSPRIGKRAVALRRR
jgi:hypothetical protein